MADDIKKNIKLLEGIRLGDYGHLENIIQEYKEKVETIDDFIYEAIDKIEDIESNYDLSDEEKNNLNSTLKQLEELLNGHVSIEQKFIKVIHKIEEILADTKD